MIEIIECCNLKSTFINQRTGFIYEGVIYFVLSNEQNGEKYLVFRLDNSEKWFIRGFIGGVEESLFYTIDTETTIEISQIINEIIQ